MEADAAAAVKCPAYWPPEERIVSMHAKRTIRVKGEFDNTIGEGRARGWDEEREVHKKP